MSDNVLPRERVVSYRWEPGGVINDWGRIVSLPLKRESAGTLNERLQTAYIRDSERKLPTGVSRI